MSLTVHRGALPYLLWHPREPPGDSALPLLVFLHGFDEGAPLELQSALRRHGPLASTAWPGALERFVVVAPQLPRRGDLWALHAAQVREIVSEVRVRSDLVTDSTFLTGFSFGGNGVLDLGLAQPELWSGLWPVDPTRVPPARPDVPVWLSAGSLTRPLLPELTTRLGLEPAGEGAGRRVYEDAGSDHVGTARLAYGDPRTYRWLRALVPVPSRQLR